MEMCHANEIHGPASHRLQVDDGLPRPLCGDCTAEVIAEWALRDEAGVTLRAVKLVRQAVPA